jgi:hypothetical protein
MFRVAVLSLALLYPGALSGQDAYELKLPASLRAQFSRAFPGYRQIRVSDYEPSTIENEKEYHKGNRCIAAEGGDFNGDGLRDFVFLVLSPGKSVKALVALRDGSTWRIRELWDLGSDYVGCCYANVLAPGKYDNFYGTTPDPEVPPASDERLSYTSKTQAPIVGAIESSGVAFFLSGKRWLHVWVSD